MRPFAAFAVGGVLLTGLVSAGPAAADPPNTDVEKQITAASKELEVVIEEYNSLRDDLRLTIAQTAVLQKQIGPLERQADEVRERVGIIAATAYRTGGLNGANVVLAAAQGHDLVRRLDTLDLLARRRHREIAELGAARDRFVTARRTLEALADQERTQQQELTVRRQHIEEQLDTLRNLRHQAYGDSERGLHSRPVRPGYIPPIPGGVAGNVVRFALAQLGKRYLWAGEGPNGYDCSGLVLAAYKTVGVILPHSSSRQRKAVAPVSRTELRPGDLVFYYSDVHHVGIYLGEGLIVHAPQPGETVRIDRVDNAPIQGFGRPSGA